MAEALIDLSTTAEQERQFIKIDGKEYDLLRREDLGLQQQAVFLSIGKRMEKLGTKMSEGDIVEGEVIELVKQMKKAVHMVVPSVEPELLNKMKESHLLAIVNAFNEANGKKKGASESPAAKPEAGEPGGPPVEKPAESAAAS